MRLIHCDSLELREFYEAEAPPYAILSHTWEEDEVSFQEMTALAPSTFHKAGFTKLLEFVNLARDEGFDYVWIDTCCIDKTSSAELSEAINSMYRWYQKADLCIAYLSDYDITSGKVTVEALRSCRWFTRGWTLQELIAPPQLVFYDKHWVCMGGRVANAHILRPLTRIPLEVLCQKRTPADYSVSHRMAWAAKRQTTRPEDIAYCLLGLFDINMPLLYGEGGQKAFMRLQEEILKTSDDQTLFAWQTTDPTPGRFVGLLASHPADFAEGDSFYSHGDKNRPSFERPYHITNRGLSMRLQLVDLGLSGRLFLAVLHGSFAAWPDHGAAPSIYLYRVSDSPNDGQFARVEPNRIFLIAKKPTEEHEGVRDIYVRQTIQMSRLHLPKISCAGFELTVTRFGTSAQCLPVAVLPRSEWKGLSFLPMNDTTKTVRAIACFHLDQSRRLIGRGWDEDGSDELCDVGVMLQRDREEADVQGGVVVWKNPVIRLFHFADPIKAGQAWTACNNQQPIMESQGNTPHQVARFAHVFDQGPMLIICSITLSSVLRGGNLSTDIKVHIMK